MHTSVHWYLAYLTNALWDHGVNKQRLSSPTASFKIGSRLIAPDETRQNGHCCHLWHRGKYGETFPLAGMRILLSPPRGHQWCLLPETQSCKHLFFMHVFSLHKFSSFSFYYESKHRAHPFQLDQH